MTHPAGNRDTVLEVLRQGVVTCENILIREKTLVCALTQALEKYGDAVVRKGGDRKITNKKHRMCWLLGSCIDGLQRHNEMLNKQLRGKARGFLWYLQGEKKLNPTFRI